MSRRKEATEASDPRRFADLLFEIVNEIGLCGFEGWAETKEHGCKETEYEGSREHGEVRRKIDNEREVDVVEQRGERVKQEVVAPDAQVRPTTPPQIASSKPSASSCLTI